MRLRGSARSPERISAREVALEGVRHVARQRRGVRRLGVRDEGGVVLADETVQEGVLRLARHTPRRARAEASGGQTLARGTVGSRRAR